MILLNATMPCILSRQNLGEGSMDPLVFRPKNPAAISVLVAGMAQWLCLIPHRWQRKALELPASPMKIG